MRVVVDPNVLVSAAIFAGGPPRAIVDAWIDERFELIASTAVLDELRHVPRRPRFRRWIGIELADEFVDALAQDASIAVDPPDPPCVCGDPDDDYLIALARAVGADDLVSGDRDLLELADPGPPVLSPRQFADLLASMPPKP